MIYDICPEGIKKVVVFYQMKKKWLFPWDLQAMGGEARELPTSVLSVLRGILT